MLGRERASSISDLHRAVLHKKSHPVEQMTREKIISVVKNFFLDPKKRSAYLRPIKDIEDPYCTIDDDLLWDISQRVTFFKYLQDTLSVEIDWVFAKRAQRLEQVYDYLERRIIKEGRRPLPKPKIHKPPSSKVKNEVARTVLLFPGQGAQKVGMAKDIVTKNENAKKLFDTAKEILGYDLWELCTQGPEEKLNSTEISQPAIFVSSIAALEQFKIEFPVEYRSCAAVAGLSLGEYTALVHAGAMSFEDALRVVKVRAEAMQKASDAVQSGMMSVLGMEKGDVETLIRDCSTAGRIYVANYLCPGNIVVAGEQKALAAVEKACAAKGRMTKRLKVSGAFHTELMQSAANKVAEALNLVEIKKPNVPVYSNVNAMPQTDPQVIKELLLKQLVSPVQWEMTINTMIKEGLMDYFEVGTGSVLTGLMRHINKKRSGEPARITSYSV